MAAFSEVSILEIHCTKYPLPKSQDDIQSSLKYLN
jgi:hypothetical protein